MTALFVAAAAALAALAPGLALFGRPDPAIAGENAGGRVTWVRPGGLAWQAGLREGHEIIALEPGETPSEWRLTTRRDGMEHAISMRLFEANLRASLPAALLAPALVAVAVVLSVRRPRAAAALSALSTIPASYPLFLSGDARWLLIGGLAALLAPVAWLLRWGLTVRELRLLTAAVAGVIAVLWASSTLVPGLAYEVTDGARSTATAVAGIGVVVLAVDWRRWAPAIRVLQPERVTDVVALAASAVGLVVAVVFLRLPWLGIAVLLALAVLLYLRLRSTAVRALDHVVQGDDRERARIRVIEEERARLARELHDVPLQEIAAVIRRLEAGAAGPAEMQSLRSVADEIRRMTVGLRPPVLDDLGLGAALAFLADQVNTDSNAPAVRLDVVDESGVLAEHRPPADVELALFRIVQEAVANARQHSGSADIAVTGRISKAEVELTVLDAGAGATSAKMRDAQRSGRFGVVAMRQRAAGINAQFEIATREPMGTRVSVRWRA